VILQDAIDKLNLELITKNLPPEEEEPKKQTKRGVKPAELDIESQPPQFAEAINQLISPSKNLPFVLICSSKMNEYIS
jgi:hypothetical protein